MLVLTRDVDESIVLDREIVITILELKGKSVKIGIEAPRRVEVLRAELLCLEGGESKERKHLTIKELR